MLFLGGIMKSRLLALAAFATLATYSSADILTTTITFGSDIRSWDGLDDPGNYTATFDVSSTFSGYTNFRLIGLGWDLTLTAEGASYLSEIALLIENTARNDQLFFTPGFEMNNPGTASFNSGGIVDLMGPGVDVYLDNDNLMHWQLFETFDDVPNAQDGFWHEGSTIDLQFEATAVPEPATLAAVGLGVAALARRRRK